MAVFILVWTAVSVLAYTALTASVVFKDDNSPMHRKMNRMRSFRRFIGGAVAIGLILLWPQPGVAADNQPVTTHSDVQADAHAAAGEDNKQLRQEIEVLKEKVSVLEQKNGQEKAQEGKPLQAALSRLVLNGGASAGYFYASNPGRDAANDAFLLSNFLLEISSVDESVPLDFAGAIGETTTPSLLGAPDNDIYLDIEYASLTFKPVKQAGLEVGLLQPNAGFESSYTFNNNHIMLGAVASQQPYNAFGARADVELEPIHLRAGYYKKRLSDDEYEVNGILPNNSWEIGIGGQIEEYNFSLYNYHLTSLRNLAGGFVEHTFQNIYVAFNIDYWYWDAEMQDYYGRPWSVGGACYISPRFGPFSIPLRLEYIDQGESRIYTSGLETHRIYAATLTPTYRISEQAYIRAEMAYVRGDNAFTDKDGNMKDDKMWAAAEVGYLF